MKSMVIVSIISFTGFSQPVDAINRTIQLTLGSVDRLPVGTNVKFKINIYKGEFDTSDNQHGSMTFDDIKNKNFIYEGVGYSETVDLEGLLPSKSISINAGKISHSVSNGKKHVIIFEIETLVTDSGLVVWDKKSILPLIVQKNHRDIIPACISVFYRSVGTDQKTWGISHHGCEDALDLSKKRAINKYN